MGSLIYVFLGGGIGSLLRYATQRWIPVSSSGFPTPTFLVNMIGCILIGFLVSYLASTNQRIQLFLITGFLGGFTTFSGYGLELFHLQQQEKWGILASYFILSNLLGILGVFLGFTIYNTLTK